MVQVSYFEGYNSGHLQQALPATCGAVIMTSSIRTFRLKALLSNTQMFQEWSGSGHTKLTYNTGSVIISRRCSFEVRIHSKISGVC